MKTLIFTVRKTTIYPLLSYLEFGDQSFHYWKDILVSIKICFSTSKNIGGCSNVIVYLTTRTRKS